MEKNYFEGTLTEHKWSGFISKPTSRLKSVAAVSSDNLDKILASMYDNSVLNVESPNQNI